MPPLRERKGDIRPLVKRFLEGACREAKRALPKIGEDVLRFLEAHAWPGNVRELKNVVERAVVLLESEELGLEDLPSEMLSTGEAGVPGGFHAQVAEFRKKLVREAVERSGGNQTKAAEALGLQRTYLARLIRQMGL